ncbi:MAG: site-2 protease family protein, partial [Halobacteria archaeon]|nr:site-2 protease family protein [Halobacteria archaeon]
TAIGLKLPVVEIAPVQDATYIELHYPALFHIIEAIVGSPPTEGRNVSLNPVVVGGWVGMFITFLNLIPAGQLDGGHIVKAIFGDYARYVSYAVPVVLFTLGVFVIVVMNKKAYVWFVWGIITLIVTTVGGAQTLDDSQKIGKVRIALAVLVFVLGILSFTPVPISVINA